MASEQLSLCVFKVQLATEQTSCSEIDLIDDDHLRPFGIKAQQIRNVSACYDVPGYLYEEIGEAKATHPCAGSVCMIFSDTHGQLCSTDVIAYYDFNPAKKHAEGKPHWNVEIRNMRNGQEIARSKPPDGHVIQDSVEITFISEFNGTTRQHTISRDKSFKSY